MNYRIVFALGCVLLPVLLTPAESSEKLLGKDWQEMTQESKSIYLMNTVATLRAQGVPVEKSAENYQAAVDWMLLYEPNAFTMELDVILKTYLYEQEPQTRPALDKLKES